MSVTYKNPPLVELIVELRWGTPTIKMPLPLGTAPFDVPAPSDPSQFAPSLDEEILYAKFGAIAAAKGFGRSERILPPGFPVNPYQVVCRYRPTDTKETSPLYQLGNGVFSANALPPYKSWKDFSPKVLEGLQMMQTACKEVGHDLPRFNTAIVRYIDAFREDLTQDLSTVRFIREVLGFGLDIPQSILKASSAPNDIAPTVNLKVPVKSGFMTIVLGQGNVGGQQGVILDTTVFCIKDLGNVPEDAVIALTEARGIVHEIFRGLTEKLHLAMKPEA